MAWLPAMTGGGYWSLALAIALMSPAPDEQDQGGPLPASLGGYWGVGESRELPPKSGEDEVLAGAIITPLGILTVISAGVMVFMTEPRYCVARLGRLGFEIERDQCGGLFAVNSVRTGYGAAMTLSGVVLLIVGLHRRTARRAWDERHFRGGVRIGFEHGQPAGAGYLQVRF